MVRILEGQSEILEIRKSGEEVYDGGVDFYFPKMATPVYSAQRAPYNMTSTLLH